YSECKRGFRAGPAPVPLRPERRLLENEALAAFRRRDCRRGISVIEPKPPSITRMVVNTISELIQPESRSRPRVIQSEASRVRLEKMFNDHHDFIWRLVRRLGLSRGSADDAAQHVFLVAAERVDDIKEGSERAFLFGTALRVARSVSRSEMRWVLEDDMDFR